MFVYNSARARPASQCKCYFSHFAQGGRYTNLVPRVLILARRRGKTLVGAGHVIRWPQGVRGKSRITLFHLKTLHFNCEE